MSWFYKSEKINESDIYDIVAEQYTSDEHADFLNDCYDKVKVGWIDCYAGDTIRKLDPIAFEISRDEEIDYIIQCILDYDSGYMDSYNLKWVDDEQPENDF